GRGFLFLATAYPLLSSLAVQVRICARLTAYESVAARSKNTITNKFLFISFLGYRFKHYHHIRKQMIKSILLLRIFLNTEIFKVLVVCNPTKLPMHIRFQIFVYCGVDTGTGTAA